MAEGYCSQYNKRRSTCPVWQVMVKMVYPQTLKGFCRGMRVEKAHTDTMKLLSLHSRQSLVPEP